jgi:uncharacterized membrane protein
MLQLRIDAMYKEQFYEELKRVFDKFPQHHMETLLDDFSANFFLGWGGGRYI